MLPTMWRNQLYLFWVTAVGEAAGRQPGLGRRRTWPSQTWAAAQPPRRRADAELGRALPRQVDVAEVDEHAEAARDPRPAPTSTRRACCCSPATVKPEGSSERLVFSVVYYHGDDVKAYTVDVHVEERLADRARGPARRGADHRRGSLLRAACSGSARASTRRLDSNSLDVPLDRPHAAHRAAGERDRRRPSDETPADEDVSPFPGWNVRTVMHPVENQWEAPFFYADEHSTFYVEGDEHASHDQSRRRVRADRRSARSRSRSPPLYEEVVIPNPRDPVWNPEWRHLVNPNFTTVLAGRHGVRVRRAALRRARG